MSIYQPMKLEQLQRQLRRLQGDPQIWPLLESTNRSLNHQSPANALSAQLGSGAQIVLEGPPGSGKTVIALYIGTRAGSLQCAYLEAQRWTVPLEGSLIDEFLITAGCDYERAQKALEDKKLVLILDAIDEAPWRPGGASAIDALPRLFDEVRGRAGLLVTVRTSRPLPLLPGSPIFAALGGIAEENLEAFLTAYAGGRGGVGAIVENLRRRSLPSAIKYSPLILRRFAEGLVLNVVPDNIAELFEMIADFQIERECQKSSSTSRPPVAGSWQEGYSDPIRHRNLVSALVYSVGRTGKKIPEPDFQELISHLLRPANLGAHSLVDIATLMAQHPLVSVAFIAVPGGIDQYHVQAAHDWVRTALFPRFMSDASFDAQVEASETWHEALPHPQDFSPAWAFLGKRGQEVLHEIVALASGPTQCREVSRWLLFQIFDNSTVSAMKGQIFEAVARLAYAFVPSASNVVDALEFDEQVGDPLAAGKPGALVIGETMLVVMHHECNANLSGVRLTRVKIEVGLSGPDLFALSSCDLEEVSIIIKGTTRVRLDGCILESVVITQEGGGPTEVINCVYDPRQSIFPENTTGLGSCEPVNIAERLYAILTLAEVLRKFVFIVDPSKPEFSKRKTNISRDNVFHGIVRHLDIAEKIVDILSNSGYIAIKPTGGVRRLDPTDKFSAEDAARFILAPTGSNYGPMIMDVLGKIY